MTVMYISETLIFVQLEAYIDKSFVRDGTLSECHTEELVLFSHHVKIHFTDIRG